MGCGGVGVRWHMEHVDLSRGKKNHIEKETGAAFDHVTTSNADMTHTHTHTHTQAKEEAEDKRKQGS